MPTKTACKVRSRDSQIAASIELPRDAVTCTDAEVRNHTEALGSFHEGFHPSMWSAQRGQQQTVLIAKVAEATEARCKTGKIRISSIKPVADHEDQAVQKGLRSWAESQQYFWLGNIKTGNVS